MAAALKMFAAAFLVAVALSGAGVSAQTHHLIGGDDDGWGPGLNISSWLLNRVFSVGDRIWFNHTGPGESVVELQGLEEFESCNLTNPIRMYTDQVVLEKEGMRYFTSGNMDSCKNGLKLPVPVQPHHDSWPPGHEDHPPKHFEPPPFGPDAPVHPHPPPAHVPPPPEQPSGSTHLDGLSCLFLVGLSLCYFGF